jgi:hypothetical protein
MFAIMLFTGSRASLAKRPLRSACGSRRRSVEAHLHAFDNLRHRIDPEVNTGWTRTSGTHARADEVIEFHIAVILKLGALSACHRVALAHGLQQLIDRIRKE